MGYLVRIVVFFICNKTLLEATASYGPTIDYCFLPTAQQATSGHCKWVQISNSTFEFGNLGRNTLQIPGGSNNKFLLLKCTASLSVKWLTRKPLGAVELFQSKEDNHFNPFPRSSEPNLYSQRLLIELGKDFSRRLRCESFSDSESVAEVYVNAWDRGYGYWSVPEGSAVDFAKVSAGALTSNILPCDAREFHGGYIRNLTFIRKEATSSSISDVSKGCVDCICKSSCETSPCDSNSSCGEIPQNYWETYKRMKNQDFPSCRSNASCARNLTKSYLNTIVRRHDCNANGVISCEDYARTHLKGDWRKCKQKLEDSTEAIIATSFANCLVEIKENFTILNPRPNDYDPRIGLRVAEGLNSLSTYECIFDTDLHHSRFHLRPYIQVRAQLSYDHDIERFRCEHILPGFAHLHMIFARCESLLECALKFEPISPFIYNEKEYLPNIFEMVKLDPKLTNNGYSNNYTHGFAQCEGLYSSSGEIVGEINYFFTGLNNKKYLTSERLPLDAVILMTRKSHQPLVHRFSDVFHCKISTFVLLPNIQFLVEYSNGEEELFKLGVASTIARLTDLPHDKNHASQTLELALKVSARMVKLTCFASWILSEDMAYREIRLDASMITSTPESIPEDKLNVFAIIGIAAAISAFLFMGILVIVVLRKYAKPVVVARNLTPDEVHEFHHGARHSTFNDSIIVPENLAFEENLKIPSSQLSIGNLVLGEGQFGVVQQGDFANQQVAVKSCKPNDDIELFKSFLKELKVMAYIGEHPNIVRFFGAVVENIEKGSGLAVLELSPYGNLLSYLRRHSKAAMRTGRLNTKYGSSGMETELHVVLNQSTLVSFCEQIANGMTYLAAKKVIHADLATRNVLVFEGNVVKITDFGLSRKLYSYNNYTKKTKVPLPWQWMALESLRLMEFSTQSDVWSFGVTVWEIFSLGQVPFFGSSWTTEFAGQLEAGMRLLKPTLAPQAAYGWMMSCWDIDPENRPPFSECARFFACLGYEENDG